MFNVTLTGYDPQPAKSFNVYPNPGNGYFHLTWQGSFDSYKVMNVTGQVIRNERLDGQSSMDLETLPLTGRRWVDSH